MFRHMIKPAAMSHFLHVWIHNRYSTHPRQRKFCGWFLVKSCHWLNSARNRLFCHGCFPNCGPWSTVIPNYSIWISVTGHSFWGTRDHTSLWCIYRTYKTSSTGFMATPGLHSMSHPSIHTIRKLISFKFCLERTEETNGVLGTHMHSLPELQDPNTHQGPNWTIWRFKSSFWPHTYGSSWTPSTFQQVHPSPNCYLSFFPMAWSNSSKWHNYCCLCPCIDISVICTFWHPYRHDIWQRKSIYFATVNSIAQLLGNQVHHTTAYYPQANGLVERFHHHLKASLRAQLTGPNWTADLPWVLLGIRTAPKNDLGCSSAELVPSVPGEFFPNYISRADSHSQLQQLWDRVPSYFPIPTSRHVSAASSIPLDLKHTRFVFVHHDPHRSPLQRPYDGPNKVLQSGDKTFTPDIRGRKETILMDRLKLAHVDLDHLTTLPEPRHQENLIIHLLPTNYSPPIRFYHHTPDLVVKSNCHIVLGGVV